MIQPTSTSPSVPVAQAQEPSPAVPAQAELAVDLQNVTQCGGDYDGHYTDFERELQRSSVGQFASSGDTPTPGPDGKPPFIITDPKVRPMNPTDAQSAPTIRTTTDSKSSIPHGGLHFDHPDFTEQDSPQSVRTTTDSKSSIPHGGLHFDHPDFTEQDLPQSVGTARTGKRPVPVGGFEQRYKDIGDHLCPDSTGRDLQVAPGDHSRAE